MRDKRRQLKRFLAFLLTAAMVITYMPAYMFAYAADGEEEGVPGKTLTPNGDGTYQLELEVTGSASTTKKASNVNVLVVYDVSSSMTHRWVLDEYGSYGSEARDTWSSGSDIRDYGSGYYYLYKRVGNQYVRLQPGERYTGTVYRVNSRGQYVEFNGNRYRFSTRRSDAGEKAVRDLTEALFEYQDEDNPSNIQMSLVTFCAGPDNSSTTKTAQDWTSRESDITNKLSETGNFNTSKLTYASGTNYEAAMRQALTALNTADKDPTYVIFVTDGQPSQSVTAGNYTNPDWHDHQELPHRYTGNNEATRKELYKDTLDEVAQTMTKIKALNERSSFYGIYAFGDEDDFLDDLVYYAHNGVERENVTHETVPTDYYYNAGDSAALNAAIAEIFQDIVNTLGITAVSIEDGTTNQVKTTSGSVSELLDIDKQSFEYWLSIPVVNNQFKRTDTVSGEEITYSVADNGDGTVTVTWGTDNSVTLQGTLSLNTLKYKWEDANALYNKKPPKAEFDDTTGEVKWDLNSVGTLLDGVTYSVTFDVYPSQYTYDTVAKIKNGDLLWSDLDPEEQKYLAENLSLRTNTQASYTYTDTRIEDAQPETVSYKNPEPVDTATYTLNIEKEWEENTLDTREPEPITMTVTQDGKDFHSFVLGEGGDWTASSFISTGLMRVVYDKDNKTITDVRILDKGHDYTFAEFDDVSYYWDLDAQTVRPMLIDSATNVSTLIKVEEGADEILSKMDTKIWLQEDDDTYFKIDGAVYKLTASSEAGNLHASNSRRSHLNLTKAVEGDAKGDEKFKFDVNVDAAFSSHSIKVDKGLLGGYSYKKVVGGKEITVDLIKEGSLYMAQYNDAAGNTVVLYGTVDDDNVFTYSEALWFSIWDPDTNSTVKGLTLEGWTEEEKNGNPTGYYYAPDNTPLTVELKAKQNLRFTNLPVGSTYTIEEDQSAMPDNFRYKSAEVMPDADSATVSEGGKTEGTIAKSSVSYMAKYTNEYTKRKLTVEKVWDDDDNLNQKRPASVSVQLKENGSAKGEPVTLNEDNDWTYTWTGLDADNTYTADETAVPTDYTKEVKETADYAVVASNVPEGTEKLTVHLLKDGEDTGKTIELTGSSWAGTFEDVEVGTYTASTDTQGVDISAPVEMNKTVTVTNSIIRKISIPFTKTWVGPKKDIRVNLLANGTKVDSIELKVADEGTGEGKHSWNGVFTDKPIYDSTGNKITYTITEDFLTAGDAQKYDTTITANDTGDDPDPSQGFTITNTNKETVDVSVEKQWDDDGDRDGLRPDSVSVQLKADGTDKGDPVALSESNNWAHTWSSLPKYNANGSEIVYTVTEENPTYNTVIVTQTESSGSDDADSADNGTADNAQSGTAEGSPDASTADPSASEAAADAQDNSVDEGGAATDADTANGEGAAAGTENGTDAPAAGAEESAPAANDSADDKAGSSKAVKAAADTEETEEVTASYTTTITGDAASGFVIKNEHTPETTSVTVTKSWDDDGDRDGLRPASIQVQLMADGVAEGAPVTLVAQPDVDHPQTDGYGPWSYTWTDLKVKKKTSEGSTPITYTVDEVEVPAGYSKEVTGDAATGFTITNRHVPETISIRVNKKWTDNNNQDGLRPRNITVMLSAGDAAESQTAILNESNQWKHEWTGLNKNYNGQPIQYTVDETAVPSGYTKTVPEAMTEIKDETGKVTGYSIEIENKHTPAKTKVEGTKIWQDDGATDRPTQIMIDILAKIGTEAAEVVDTVTVVLTDGEVGERQIKAKKTDDNTWTFSTDEKYDAYSAGSAIIYSIAEHAVEGYISSQDGNTLTNTKTVDVSVKKVWDDADDQDGIRPESLTVSLLANGQPVTEEPAEAEEGSSEEETTPVEKKVTLSEENNWSGEITDLPMYVNGNKVTYTWSEDNLPSGYTLSKTEVQGNITTLTNKHVPEKISVPVQKVWVDSNNKSAARPDSVTFQLYKKAKGSEGDPKAVADKKLILTAANAKVTDEAAGTKDENTWTGTFAELPKYEGGKELTYTIKEMTGSDADATAIEADGTLPGKKVGYDYKVSYSEDSLTVTNTLETVDLEITKDLLEYVDHNNSVGGNVTATFVFKIIGRKEGVTEPVYSTQIGIQLDKAGTASKTLKNLPKGLTYTVEEVYSGSYTASPSSKTLGEDDLEEVDGKYTYKVKFENSGKDIEYGGGVINTYDGKNDMKQDGNLHKGAN